MGHNDQRAGEVHQEILQPGNGLVVQVVGGLVQQQDVRVAEQRLSQQHLHLFAALQVAHDAVMHIRTDAQAGQQGRRVGLGIPAVHLGKFALQLGRALAVLIGEIRLGVQGVLLLHDVVQALVAHDDGVEHRVGVVLELILFQRGHTLIRRIGDGTGGGLQLAGENAQEGRFSRAVGADDAVAVAGHELEVCAREELLTAEGQGNIADCNHG